MAESVTQHETGQSFGVAPRVLTLNKFDEGA